MDVRASSRTPVAAEGPRGGLLTASYPNQHLSAWLASSKDHIEAQAHVPLSSRMSRFDSKRRSL